MRALITALTLSILLALFNTAAIAQNADAQTVRDLQTIVDRAVRERSVNMMGHRCQIAEARYHHAAKFDEGTSYWWYARCTLSGGVMVGYGIGDGTVIHCEMTERSGSRTLQCPDGWRD